MGHSGRKLIESQEFVKCRIGHDPRNQGRVHGVSRPFGDHVAEQRLSDQRQIADQVEDLVAAAFVRKAETARDS